MQWSRFVRERRFSPVDYTLLLNLAAAAGLLVAGWLLPAFTNDRLASGEQSFSIIGGAVDLGLAGSPGFMLVILLFSVVFPAAKLLAIGLLWLLRFDVATEERGMHWLELLGKWSMLDVFVIATTIGATHLKLLNRTTTEAGIYVFGLAILLSMLASLLLRHKLRTRVRLTMPTVPGRERLLGIVVGAGSLLLFFAGIALPLFSVEKWLFWDKDYSLLSALPKMLEQGELLLPLVVFLFVILLPLCRFLSLTATRLSRRPAAGLVQLAYGLEKWTMWEVYALALIIVAFKLGDFTSVGFRSGFWLIMAMVPLSFLDGWLFRRRLELHRDSGPA